jgi:hypothetical protein
MGLAYKYCSLVIDDQLDGSVPVSWLKGTRLHGTHTHASFHDGRRNLMPFVAEYHSQWFVAELCADNAIAG